MLEVEEGRTERSDERRKLDTSLDGIGKKRKLNEEIEVVLPRKGHGLLEKKKKKSWSERRERKNVVQFFLDI